MPKKKVPWLTILTILGKSAKLLKVLKAFKIAKPFLTLATMSLSFFAYAFWLGPWFALALVLLLFVHEMGHVAAMRLRGLGTPTPVFIPFLGAAIFAPKFKSRDEEAFVGYGGPLLGSIAAIAVFGAYLLTPRDSDLATILLAASYAGVFLNLFNLLPISPLDGGRVTQAVGTWFKYIGLFLLAIFSIALREPVILLIWILVLTELNIVPVRIRAVLSVVFALSMGILMYLGYSTQPFWIDIVDYVFATILSAVNVLKAISPEDADEKDDRPGLTKRQRFQWAGLYGGLTVLLVIAIVIQAQYLPHHVQ